MIATSQAQAPMVLARQLQGVARAQATIIDDGCIAGHNGQHDRYNQYNQYNQAQRPGDVA